MELTSHTAKGVNKLSRYGWTTKDQPGTLQMIHKDRLKIDDAYQRGLIKEKVTSITASWSWLSLGALVVGHRHGDFWVIDGQHRLMAAKRRSDILMLPCVVFETEDVKSEARGFLDLNTGRKPVTAVAKQKALVTAGDEVAAYVQAELDALGLEIKEATNIPGQIKCIAWCVRRAAEDREAFRQVLRFGAELSAVDKVPVMQKLLEGLWWLHTKCMNGLDDKRLAKRLREKGATELVNAATRAAAYYHSGGGKVWAQGMLAELNKGLQYKFTMNGDEG